MKIQNGVKQLVEDGETTLEQIQLFRNQLNDVEASLSHLPGDVCFISAKMFGQGLITVSSNLKNVPPTSVEVVFKRKTKRTGHLVADSKPTNTTATSPNVNPQSAFNPSPFAFPSQTPTRITPTTSTAFGKLPSNSPNNAPTFIFAETPTKTSSPTSPFAATTSPFAATPTTSCSSPFIFGTPTTIDAPVFPIFGATQGFSFNNNNRNDLRTE